MECESIDTCEIINQQNLTKQQKKNKKKKEAAKKKKHNQVNVVSLSCFLCYELVLFYLRCEYYSNFFCGHFYIR